MSDNRRSPAKDCIQIWRFRTAPQGLRELFPKGRDTDWLAQVPVSFDGDLAEWLEAQWKMAYTMVNHQELGDGSVICLGDLQISKRILVED